MSDHEGKCSRGTVLRCFVSNAEWLIHGHTVRHLPYHRPKGRDDKHEHLLVDGSRLAVPCSTAPALVRGPARQRTNAATSNHT